MAPSRLTRRRVLRAAAAGGAALVAARLLPAAELAELAAARLRGVPRAGVLARALAAASPAAARAAPRYDGLLRQAPVARWWASTARRQTPCSACHRADELARLGAAAAAGPDARHDHGATRVQCLLCARECRLREGERGECGARVVQNGDLRSLVYGHPAAVHVDPIEKKPFYHFLPGSRAYSLGTAGCPLHCEFCQNWQLSQSMPEEHRGPFTPAADVAREAQAHQAPVIAFTYNEPTVFAEYLCDIARAARPLGVRCVAVSCGFMNQAPLAEMCEVLDAIKIDLKGFSEDFYRRVAHAELRPVLRAIEQIARHGTHLEIVNLVVPTLNDSEAMLGRLAGWLVDAVGPDVPVHFTRFHPDYRLLNLPPTPARTLELARAIARERGLRYAYVGNLPGHPGNHTSCPKCGKIVVRREGFFVEEIQVRDGKCAFCGEPIAGVWS